MAVGFTQALVFGNGRSGKAAAELLRREGVEVRILDGAEAFPDCAACNLLPATTICITSPGIALDHPWQKAARAAGLTVISELQLGAERWRARGGRMLAVTGSKGKSSVVKLVASALKGVPCGNYGTPLCEVVNTQTGEGAALPWAVVEVSSFQLETTCLPEDAFEAAALLNLQEDHLDRHGHVSVYHALKRQLLAMTPRAIDASRAAFAAACAPAADVALLAGSYFDNEILRVNGLCAVALLRAAGLDDASIRAAFTDFEPLPHRFQRIAVQGGVTWIDDSKATSLAALAAGVAMCADPVRLIAGGLPKGDNPLSVIPRLRFGVKKVYLIGCCANQLLDAWRETVPCEVCETLDRAVESARRDAVSGESVLLSPGAASFDQFKSYGERGDVFATLVRAGA